MISLNSKQKFSHLKFVIGAYFVISVLAFGIFPGDSFAAENIQSAAETKTPAVEPVTITAQAAGNQAEKPSSSELIDRSWEAHGKKDAEATFKYTQQCIDLYKAEADKEQASLNGLPRGRKEIEAVQVLNDVATAYFIQAEAYRYQGKKEDSIKTFQTIIDKYPYAQAWDQRGWYWVIAKTSGEAIGQLKGLVPVVKKIQVSKIPTTIKLYDTGREDFVNYEKYGECKHVGTKDYQYAVKDQDGLSAAVGEGIYPNTSSVRWDPEYKKVQ
ncbi:MAG: tetratricopeptide repeat protein, partial [Candidatus Omnitrophica bacterium]|nr:tetratricopeptide repeat protein [Candidatus Omnitrophota bacterium]